MRIRVTKRESALSKALSQRLDGLGLGLTRVVAMVGMVGFLFSEAACASPAALDLTITVRVYNYTQAPPTILARAEREAGRIFGEAGLKVLWLDCTPGYSTPIPQDPCQEAIETADIRLRILLAPVRNMQDSVFGFAIAPALASVYYESALGFAKYDQAEFEAPIVLGCAIAHEIGHLLLGSNRHSVSGIMRARWDRRDIREELQGAMLFTPQQARLMQAEMRRRITLLQANYRPIR
jgi:hypothetical protein